MARVQRMYNVKVDGGPTVVQAFRTEWYPRFVQKAWGKKWVEKAVVLNGAEAILHIDTNGRSKRAYFENYGQKFWVFTDLVKDCATLEMAQPKGPKAKPAPVVKAVKAKAKPAPVAQAPAPAAQPAQPKAPAKVAVKAKPVKYPEAATKPMAKSIKAATK